MNIYEKTKLHEITESVKENYLLRAIEESTSEKEVIYTKKFLNETFNTIEKILVEEAIADSVKQSAIVGAASLAAGAGLGAYGAELDDRTAEAGK
jgi:hypothetical protein